MHRIKLIGKSYRVTLNFVLTALTPVNRCSSFGACGCLRANGRTYCPAQMGVEEALNGFANGICSKHELSHTYAWRSIELTMTTF